MMRPERKIETARLAKAIVAARLESIGERTIEKHGIRRHPDGWDHRFAERIKRHYERGDDE